MNKGLSLVFLALLAFANVHQIASVENLNFDRVKALLQQQERALDDLEENSDGYFEKVKEYISLFSSLEKGDGHNLMVDSQINEIGPNFNGTQFAMMVQRVVVASYQRKCKKISGDEAAYVKALESAESLGTCLESWFDSEKFDEKFESANKTQEFKPFIKQVCSSRNGFFGCVDTYVQTVSGCLYTHEQEVVRKVVTIVKNMLGLACAQEENDFSLLGAKGQECFASSQVEIKTCSNKAAYSIAKRLLEKWIENEHFSFKFDVEDCKAFDAAKSCFVSSVENCTDPSAKTLVSSAFDIIRAESECAKM